MRALQTAALVLVFGNAIPGILAATRDLQAVSTSANTLLDRLCLEDGLFTDADAAQLTTDLLAMQQAANAVLNKQPEPTDKNAVLEYVEQIKPVILSTHGLFESCMGQDSVLQSTLGPQYEDLVESSQLGAALKCDHHNAVQYFITALQQWEQDRTRPPHPPAPGADENALTEALDNAHSYLMEDLGTYVQYFWTLVSELENLFSDIAHPHHRIQIFDAIADVARRFIEDLTSIQANFSPAIVQGTAGPLLEAKERCSASWNSVYVFVKLINEQLDNNYCGQDVNSIATTVKETNDLLGKHLSAGDSSGPTVQVIPLAATKRGMLEEHFQILAKGLERVTSQFIVASTANVFVLLERLRIFFQLDRGLLLRFQQERQLVDDPLGLLMNEVEQQLDAFVAYFEDIFREKLVSDVGRQVASSNLATTDDKREKAMYFLVSNTARHPYYLWRLYRSLAALTPYVDPVHCSADLVTIVKEAIGTDAVSSFVSERISWVTTTLNLLLPDWSTVLGPIPACIRSWKQFGRSIQYMVVDSEDKAHTALVARLNLVCVAPDNQAASAPVSLVDEIKTINAALQKLLTTIATSQDSHVLALMPKFKRFVELGHRLASCRRERWDQATAALIGHFEKLVEQGWKRPLHLLSTWLRAELNRPKGKIPQPPLTTGTAGPDKAVEEFFERGTAQKATAIKDLYDALKGLCPDDDELMCSKRVAFRIFKDVRLWKAIPDVEKRIADAEALSATSVGLGPHATMLEAYKSSWTVLADILREVNAIYLNYGGGGADEERQGMAASVRSKMVFVAIVLIIVITGLAVYVLLKSSENVF